MSSEAGKRLEAAGDIAVFGPFRLVPAARRIERDGKPVEIGGRALDVLIELVKHAGQVVSKADLMAAIWADTTVVEGVLRTHVYNLRKALGDSVAGARYVTSVAGQGYCFVAPVVRTAAEATALAAPNVWQVPHGLPLRLARMAGRDDEVRILGVQLAERRFVTVLGAAGIGKTTVAVAVGHALLEDFGGGVRFVELGALTDPALVAATVASTLGIPTRTDNVLEALQAFLQDKRMLLVLDNCEHVVGAVATLTEHLFLHAPRMHLLTTSREALRVEGEHTHRLGPLAMPTEAAGLDVDTIQTFPAVQVFLERAAASGWSGELTDGDVPIVAEACRRLDGVPLAIELAASFVGQCGLHGMAAVLDEHLGLLWKHGRRTAPPRQQTLHALIAWSYDRLPDHERVVLRRLSVFVGTFSLDAARALVLDGGEPPESLLENMNELVAKSLLSASVADGAVLYRLLETTRVYAFEQLAESAELERMRLRHALLFTERLERAADLGNVRAALKWSFSSPAGHSAGVRLAAAAARMLIDLGLMTECYDWCRRALDVLGPPDTGTLFELRLSEALAVSAMFTRGNGNEVRVALIRGLEIARALGALDHELRLLERLNAFLVRIGDYRGALEVALSSVDAAQRASTTSEMTLAELMLGRSYHMCGDQTLAQEHLDTGLRLAAASGEAPTVIFGDAYTDALLTLTRPLLLRGHADRAVAVARQLLDENARPTPPVNKCLRLIYCEQVFVWRGEWDEAERLLQLLAEHVETYSLSSYRGVEGALRGELLVKTGRPGDGCNLLKIGVSSLKAARNAALDTLFAGALGDGLAALGSLSEALSTVEAALELAKGRGGTWDMPELLRRSAVFLASRSRKDARAADEALSAAIELARRQGALAWELRATMALARERLRRGGSAGVLDDLARVYKQFSEGMGAPDLQAARSLLEQRVER